MVINKAQQFSDIKNMQDKSHKILKKYSPITGAGSKAVAVSPVYVQHRAGVQTEHLHNNTRRGIPHDGASVVTSRQNVLAYMTISHWWNIVVLIVLNM